jgi:ATP synthase protein I
MSAPAPARAPGEVRRRLNHLPSGLLACAAVLVVGAVVAAVAAGPVAVAGVALGTALVAGSYSGSSVVIAWADSIDRRLVLPVGLVTYAVKFAALGVAVAALAGTGWDGLTAFGVTVIAATLAWAVAQAWWTWHARIPYVDV